MNEQEILFASLIGSKVLKLVPRLASVENELSKHVLPPQQFFPFVNGSEILTAKNEIKEYSVWEANKPVVKNAQFFPMEFSIDEGNSWFLLPYEPLVTLGGGNKVVKRDIAKWNSDSSKGIEGTIKERWSRSDWDIDITGVLIGSVESNGGVADCFPRDDFEKLRKVMTNAKEVRVNCPLLEMCNITRMVIESFVFPFSKGENVQGYNIKAVSDFSHNILLEL